MSRYSAQALRTLAARMLEAVGMPADEAQLSARLVVEANLSGHDTHGIRQIPRYMDLIQRGVVVAGAPVTLVRETPTTAVLDGHHNLGFVAATRAVEVAIDKARELGLSAVGVRNLNHVGRAGAYPEMIAAAGLVGLVTVNAQGRGLVVAPFGGIGARIGTNPMGAGFPNPEGPPVLLDFATSAVAANKIRQAHSRDKPAGAGWIMDTAGNPTTDPDLFMRGQANLLPLGGQQGHKGYGLAVMVDLLSGVLAGSGTAVSAEAELNNGTFIICIDPEVFLTRAQYNAEVSTLAAHLRATPTRPGDPPVMLPGEYEARHRAERSRDGVHIESAVWENVASWAAKAGVPLPEPLD